MKRNTLHRVGYEKNIYINTKAFIMTKVGGGRIVLDICLHTSIYLCILYTQAEAAALRAAFQLVPAKSKHVIFATGSSFLRIRH